ncbi:MULTISPECIES: protein-L-isoaspartate O-methyltransferase [Zoogloea]|jgi:protein-L-isoaspartate(D-aspartate) O-methyltransferase|uniref:Protein-L-isoaspartate O-methyltransferase n=1 Tax=Zoogloea oleivorans TaxID=1552750 RepID=A0A6C2D5I8_9RHOO|nr:MULTISPECIES: protein-L-isoaspartate O-methyltransferase [Zoogloea]MBP8132637.1 protein-L-isoaspartate O-methyltransferase [Zoogloea sp.]MBT9496822.1 protein-L-isoaspartate O-methyltransferase [Zoogloea sp.]MDD2668423.1 protein-L-isoaspartate O-methyltransferase [Zoogloea sp.]MDY0035289.1 protein-L-isoaspartate O-methyltransferase [Zoogloea oleivorans]TYC61104.1 protein-L-isoaspartate O-methyltransferase [Zoogloea oleivorans]
MNFEQARFNMVEQQVRPWEVLDFGVLDLLMSVRREEFVPEAYKSLALSEGLIPLGHGASMLVPVIEGKILQAVQVKRSDKVLEVGAGSGYFAALLAAKADWVRTVDIEPALVNMAHDNLKRYGVENVIVEEGDAVCGWPGSAPYDLIVVSGGVPQIPESLLQQVKVGGRLFAFVGEAPLMTAQLVTCVAEGEYRTESLFENLVPMMRNAPRKSQFTF